MGLASALFIHVLAAEVEAFELLVAFIGGVGVLSKASLEVASFGLAGTPRLLGRGSSRVGMVKLWDCRRTLDMVSRIGFYQVFRRPERRRFELGRRRWSLASESHA